MLQRNELEGRRVALHGFVEAGSVVKEPGRHAYRFRLVSRAPRPRGVVSISFEGTVPDTFGPEAEVVAQGVLRADGELRARLVSAKCPRSGADDPHGRGTCGRAVPATSPQRDAGPSS